MIKRIFAAMDFTGFEEFREHYKLISDDIVLCKVGYQLFYSDGEKVMDFLREEGKSVFLDLKLDDIPNTVEKGIASLSRRFKFDYITVHISGGSAALKAAQKAASESGIKILGVTVLTSLDKNDMLKLGGEGDIAEIIQKRVDVAKEAGIDGVIISYRDLEQGIDTGGLLKVTPGIKYAEEEKGDQKRVATPKEALGKADYIVMGRSLFRFGTKRLKEELK